jgi:large subunit ribosomal protein L19
MEKKVIDLNKEFRADKKMAWEAGDVVKVHLKIKEGGKERVQVFEGLVIAIKGGQSSSPTITVRKVSHGVGVEMILPVLSPNISKIELLKKAKVRRAKLYYVRDLTTKQSRMKYKDISAYLKKEEEQKEAQAKEAEKEPAAEENPAKKKEEK